MSYAGLGQSALIGGRIWRPPTAPRTPPSPSGGGTSQPSSFITPASSAPSMSFSSSGPSASFATSLAPAPMQAQAAGPVASMSTLAPAPMQSQSSAGPVSSMSTLASAPGGGYVASAPTPSHVATAPARATPAPSAAAFGSATLLKAEVDRLFNDYRRARYSDPVRRNNLRRDMLATGRRMVLTLIMIRPASEQERLRLRALASSALASSQVRQLCFSNGAAGCGRFGLSEPDGPTKTNDEFVAVTRPLDTFLRNANTSPIATPVARTPARVGGLVLAPPSPASSAAVVSATQVGAKIAAAKLAADIATSKKTTNPTTKAAADNVVVAQAGADAAAKAAQDAATKAQDAAQAAQTAIATAQATNNPADVAAAQIQTQAADLAHTTAEEAAVAATEVAATADAARSTLEAAAAATNDTSAQQATTDASVTVAVSTAGLGPLGISWKAWGAGAAILIGGYLVMNSKMMSANRRKRVRRNRRRR